MWDLIVSVPDLDPTILWPPSWKDRRPQFHLCKSMAMYFWTNYSGFNGEIVGKIFVIPS